MVLCNRCLLYYEIQIYTVRPLFKALHNTVKCETYEPTNSCVKNYTCTCVQFNINSVQFYTSCVFFYTTVGRFICFTVLCNFFFFFIINFFFLNLIFSLY